jgi:phenylalanyl-tRNA synthetase alpha subunit
MKIKINVTENEMQALLTALRVQKQELTERMLFESDDLDIPEPLLMMMFNQTNNVYQQVLNYASESLKMQFKQIDQEYINELSDMKDSLLHKCD